MAMKDLYRFIADCTYQMLVSIFLLCWVFFWPTEEGEPGIFKSVIRLIPILFVLDLVWVFAFIK